jgi:hypothetical protein
MPRDELDLVRCPGLAKEIHDAADIVGLARFEGGGIPMGNAGGDEWSGDGDRHCYGEQQESEKTKKLPDALQRIPSPSQLASREHPLTC